MNKSINKLAFTLLEVMISISMIIVTITAIYQISDSVKSAMISTEDRVSAMYLAQEWLEFMRNRRDFYVSQSWNKETWWNAFLKEVFWSNINFTSWLKTIKTLHTEKKLWIFTLYWENLKDITPWWIDDICWIDLDKCIYEKISLSKKQYWDQNNNTWMRDFYRKIVIEKNKNETNLIKVKIVIYWEDKWTMYNFVMQEDLWNIAIY